MEHFAHRLYLPLIYGRLKVQEMMHDPSAILTDRERKRWCGSRNAIGKINQSDGQTSKV